LQKRLEFRRRWAKNSPLQRRIIKNYRRKKLSAEELSRRAVERISELRDRATEYSLNARFRPASQGERYTPASSAEEIALQVLEGNALVRGYTAAIQVIADEYKRMMQPDDDKIPEQKIGSHY
jgi:hypothetical protein